MIIKVRFKDLDNKEHNMLFGNSYKKWERQYCEYLRRWDNLVPVRAWKSKSEWKRWGGLKWCNEDSFQEELNREGCQTDDVDNPKPRQYSEMKFWEFDSNDLPDKYKY